MAKIKDALLGAQDYFDQIVDEVNEEMHGSDGDDTGRVAMRVPKDVQQWLDAREEFLKRLAKGDMSGPRVQPVVRIGKEWFFEDAYLRKYRNIRTFEWIDM